MATTQIVEADDKKVVSVDRLPWANTLVPPAGFLGVRTMVSGSMVVPAESMTDQYAVGALLVELAIGFINQLVARQVTSTDQLQWLIEVSNLWCNDTYGVAID